MILLVEWQFLQVLAFVFGGVVSFWEMVLCMFGEEMIYWEVRHILLVAVRAVPSPWQWYVTHTWRRPLQLAI